MPTTSKRYVYSLYSEKHLVNTTEFDSLGFFQELGSRGEVAVSVTEHFSPSEFVDAKQKMIPYVTLNVLTYRELKPGEVHPADKSAKKE